jgi:hypothetical protein
MKRIAVAIVAGIVMAIAAYAGAAGTRIAFSDGTYRVGKDIKPGTYRTGSHSTCYWARLRSFTGSLSSIIANDNASWPSVVTILRTDKGFETRGCGNWTSNLARITKSKTRFGAGTYIVRTDINPGTYRSCGGGACYWARLRSFTGSTNAIIANDNASGSTIVTIRRTDRGFHSHGCATWTRF